MSSAELNILQDLVADLACLSLIDTLPDVDEIRRLHTVEADVEKQLSSAHARASGVGYSSSCGWLHLPPLEDWTIQHVFFSISQRDYAKLLETAKSIVLSILPDLKAGNGALLLPFSRDATTECTTRTVAHFPLPGTTSEIRRGHYRLVSDAEDELDVGSPGLPGRRVPAA